MIYELMRAIAGPYLRSFIDYYISHQSVFNIIIVIAGFSWIIYKDKYKKEENSKKTNFLGIEIKEK